MIQLRRTYITRLRRLLALRRNYGDALNESGLLLLRRCIDATAADCREAGADLEANTLLRNYEREAHQ